MLVLGDSMADWLAYGLEDAYSEQPDMGVIRKHKTDSGLIKYQPKGDPADWAAAAKGILATEKPDAIVVMLGLDDRQPIREPAADKSDKASDKKDAKAKPDAKSDAKDAKTGEAKPGATAPRSPMTRPSIPNCRRTTPPTTMRRRPLRQKRARARRTASIEFREERWVELYIKKIEELIAVLKTKGVPVLWVGLPAVRGPKATADMLFLDALYRDAAGKAGITYVDVWDGFVDEVGRFLQKGPDFQGQIRQLRSDDGVYFTRAGARKLAHYVEREITRLLARVRRRLRCRPNRQRPTPMRCPVSRRRARSPDRSCRWWRPPSEPINCSAAPDHGRRPSMRWRRERWSRASRWRRPPAAPMISSGPAARSDENRSREKRR